MNSGPLELRAATQRRLKNLCKPLLKAMMLCSFVAFALCGVGQNVFAQDPLNQPGAPAFTTAEPVELGFLNLGNGNLHQQIGLGSFPQRGARPLSAAFVYDSRIWQVLNFGNGNIWQPTNVGSQGGWRFVTTADPGRALSQAQTVPCFPNGINGQPVPDTVLRNNFTWTDPNGTTHTFPIATEQPVSGTTCSNPPNIPTASAFATDATGLRMFVTNYSSILVFGPDGTQLSPSVQDTNGNILSGGTDTLGRTPIKTTLTCNNNANQTCYDLLNSQGGSSRVTVTTENISVSTAFGVSGVTEFSGTITVIQQIALPDNKSYAFGYDSYGLLNSITLPTGGQITYAYSNFTDPAGNTNRWVTNRTSGGGTSTYAPLVLNQCASGSVGCEHTVTTTKPSGDQTVHTFILNNGAWQSQVDSYTGPASGLSPLLATTASTWDFSQPCLPSPCTGASNIRVLQTTTRLLAPTSSVTSQTKTTYADANSTNVASVQTWKFSTTGSFAATPDRETDFTYLNTPPYAGKNIINRVLSATVKDGSGNPVSVTNFVYDGGSLTQVNGTPNHDDTNFGTGNTVRGNATQLQRCIDLSACSTFLASTASYDTTGKVTQAQDTAGNITSFDYTDRFFTDNGVNPPAPFTPAAQTHAYLTGVTVPGVGTSTLSYYFNTGKVASTKDANGADSFSHFLDPLNLDRLTNAYGPVAPNGNRPWSLTVYDPSEAKVDSYGSITEATASAGCTSCTHSQALTDNLGRVITQTLVSDPEGATSVTTTYDTTGRVLNSSHPARPAAGSTDGVETPDYDGLGRIIKITHADQSFSQTFYGQAVTAAGGAASQFCPVVTCGVGFPVLGVDEAGKMRQTWTDGFGRLIEVDEPGLTPATLGTGSATVIGSEQSIGGTSATAGTGSATVNGSEQSISGTSATSGTGSVSISGNERSITVFNKTVYDTGTVTITVNGFSKSASYGQFSNSGSIASALVSSFNGDSSSPVTASLSGSNVNLTSKATGAATNYSLSTSSASTKGGFSGPSFFASSAASLSGGTDAKPTIFDSGTVSITVNGVPATASYGQGDTTVTVVQRLQSNAGSLPVTVGASGSTLTLTAKTTGSATNYSLSAGSSTSQPGTFSHPSFTMSVSGSALTGGTNGTATIFDSGTVSVTVNSVGASASYGQGDTAASVAQNLQNAMGSLPVTVSLSGSTINIIAKQPGAAGNYSLSATSSTSQPGTFSSPSFTVSVSGTALTGGTNSVPTLASPIVTEYLYDALGNLTQVTQNAQAPAAQQQNRTYLYDTLSRVKSATAPETGTTGSHTTTYFYTNAAGGLCSGNPSSACRVTDPRGITTTLVYDSLGRVLSVSYSDTTPGIHYGYDGVAPAGCATAPPALTASNPKGRRSSMCDASGATSWSYDAAGRILIEKRIIAGITKTISYAYNLDGSISTVTYPSGRKVAYTVSNAERLTTAKDAGTGIQYAIAASYAATGGLQGLISGQISGGFGGVTETHSYNNRLEYTGTQASSTNGTALNLGFNFTLPGGNNGSVASITNNVDNGRSESVQYDQLSRIASVATQATTGADCWGQSFGIDTLANLTSMSVTQCSSTALSTTANTNNQLAILSYDSAGNTTNDGAFSYTYDGENRITSAAGVSYIYDGNGVRVEKTTGTTGTLYWRSISGDAIAETDLNGNTVSEYVFMAGRRLARLDASANVFYYFPDPLGNTRTITNAQGQVCYDADFTPYGQEMSHTERLQTAACPQNYKFTGYERDAETGNDYAFARYYNPRLGRFMTPDLLGGGIGDPQSHNRYAYVGNNPANNVDPSGLCFDSLLNTGASCNGGGGDGGGGTCTLDGINLGCDQVLGPGGLVSASGVFDIANEFNLLAFAFAPTFSGDLYVGGIRNNEPFRDEINVTLYGNLGLLSLLGGGWEAQKKKDLIKAALATKNLSSCLHKFFGPGNILTNANVPAIDASKNLDGATFGRTDPANVPDSGRATIQIDKGIFTGLSPQDPQLVGTYLHETANALAIQRFTRYTKETRAFAGPLGGPPIDHGPYDQIHTWDHDIGKAFETCIFEKK